MKVSKSDAILKVPVVSKSDAAETVIAVAYGEAMNLLPYGGAPTFRDIARWKRLVKLDREYFFALRQVEDNPTEANLKKLLKIRTRLHGGPGPRTAIPRAIRKRILAAGLCFYCGGKGPLEVDHVVPISAGGTNDEGNLIAACKKCNASKHASTYEDWQERKNRRG